MSKPRLWLVLFFLMASGICRAQQDSQVRIGTDGTLSGFPQEFGPGVLLVAFSKDSLEPVASVELQLGGRTTRLPACMTRLLKSVRLEDVRAAGSWHHDEKGSLPPYLLVRFLAPGHETAMDGSGHAVLFNLRTSGLIWMSRFEVKPDQGQRAGMAVSASARFEAASLCSPSEMRSAR